MSDRRVGDGESVEGDVAGVVDGEAVVDACRRLGPASGRSTTSVDRKPSLSTSMVTTLGDSWRCRCRSSVGGAGAVSGSVGGGGGGVVDLAGVDVGLGEGVAGGAVAGSPGSRVVVGVRR